MSIVGPCGRIISYFVRGPLLELGLGPKAPASQYMLGERLEYYNLPTRRVWAAILYL